MALKILSAFMIGLALISTAVWWRIAGLLRAKELPLAYRGREPAIYHPFVVSVMLIWLAIDVSRRLVANYRGYHVTPDLAAVQGACQNLAMTWCLLLAVLYLTSRNGLADYGMDRKGWRRSLKEGALGFAASVLPVFLFMLVTRPFRSEETEHVFIRILSEQMSVKTVAWIALAVVVLAPLAEELIFRVTLQGWLETRYPPAWAIGLSALIFAGVHGWPDALPLLPLAFVLGYVYWRTHSYLAVVVVHALFNATNVMIAVLRHFIVMLTSG